MVYLLEPCKAIARIVATFLALLASISESFHHGHSVVYSDEVRDDVDDVVRQPGHLQGDRELWRQATSGVIGAAADHNPPFSFF